MHLYMDLFRRRFGIFAAKLPDVRTVGIINETQDGMFFPVIDYDGKAFSAVMKDLKRLNRIFGLCTFAIFLNSRETLTGEDGESFTIGNYGVVGIDKLTFHEHYDMLGQTRCDPRFREINSRRGWPHGNWVLRMTEKEYGGNQVKGAPVLLGLKRFHNRCRHPHSSAIIDFLRGYWLEPSTSINPGNQDGLHELMMVKYGTHGNTGDKGVRLWQKSISKG